MSDQVVEFFTEKEWYDQDEISMNKRLAVRDFYEWLQSRKTPLALDADNCPACEAKSVIVGTQCLVCGVFSPRGKG